MMSWPSRPALALWTMGLALTSPGCRGCSDEEAPSTTPTAAEKQGEALEPAPAPAPAPVPLDMGTDADFVATPVAAGEHVLGHILARDLEATLERARAQIKLPAVQPYFSADGLRKLLTTRGVSPELVQNIRFDAPIGCVVANPRDYETPGSCFVFYEGGLAQLIQDLAASTRIEDAMGHAARYRVEGAEIFVDELEGALAFTSHADLFAKTKSDLDPTLVSRPVEGDIEIVVHVADVARHYSDTVSELLDSLGKVESPPSEASSTEKALAKRRAARSVQELRRFLEVDQLHAQLALEPAGIVLRVAAILEKGSYWARTYSTIAGTTSQQSILQRLPDTTWAAAAIGFDLGSYYADDQILEEQVAKVADSYTALTGIEPERAEAMVRPWVRDFVHGPYGSELVMALLHPAGRIGAFLLVRNLEEGAKAREQWRAWTDRFTPDQVLAGVQPRLVTWRFEPAAQTIEGVSVDRWIIEPTAEGRQRLGAEMAAQPRMAEWSRRLGAWRLTIDRIESDGRVAWVVIPGEGEGVTASVVAAWGGRGNLEQNPALRAVLKRYSATTGLAVFDIKRALAWANQAGLRTGVGALPLALGRDLSDVVLAATVTERGMHMEWFVSQATVNHLTSLVQLAQFAGASP